MEEKKNPNPNLNVNLNSSPLRLMNGYSSAAWFEIRLFYVRIAPCVTDNLPDLLKIRHLRREMGVSLEINGTRVPASDTASLSLRRDRIDKESSEVTYVSTDTLRVTGAIEFEVYYENKNSNKDDMILCGNLERLHLDQQQQHGVVLDKDYKTGWSMDCYSASASSSFFHCISCPSIEVYVAGCCSGLPLILTKTIQLSPRRKHLRHAMLDAIPEDDETRGSTSTPTSHTLILHRKQLSDTEVEEYDAEGKIVPAFYSGDMYTDEDGQLTWFNAGVRVGVGIGLGMCLGIGIGVGLLLRSYQATTRTFRRRFS